MISKEEAEKRRVEDQLQQNFSKLKLKDTFDGDPKTVSLNYHEIAFDDSFKIDYKVQNNHLIVDLWANNYKEGVKIISGYWAVLSATKNPHDKFYHHSRLITTLYHIIFLTSAVTVFLASVFSTIFLVFFGFLFNYVGIIGIVLSSCAYSFYWVLLLKWKKRIELNLEINLKTIRFYLSDSEKKFVKGLVSSVVDKVAIQYILGFILILIILIFYMVPSR